MIRTQVYLPDDLHRELKLKAATSGKNFSELIREGVRKVVAKKATRNRKKDIQGWKDFIGFCKTDFGGKSGQELIDDYYKNDVV